MFNLTKPNNVVIATAAIGGLVSIISLAIRSSERNSERNDKIKMEEIKGFNGMMAIDRKEIMIEKEKTKQAEFEARKAEAELERVKITRDLVNDPFTDKKEAAL